MELSFLGRDGKGFLMNTVKEEQRYGRNKDTVINHAYIASGSYRKKYDEISSDRSLNRLVYNLAKEMLYHRSGTRYEDMYWIDMNTMRIVYKIIDSTVEEKILYTKRIRRIIRRKKGLMTIHSHPSSFPPSIEDFNSAYANHYSFGIVCGHSGNLFIYSSKEHVPTETYYYLAGKYYKEYGDEHKAQILALTDLCKVYNIYFREVAANE